MDKKDLIAIFKAETDEHLTKLNKGLVELEKHPDKLELVRDMNREAHTIKGSARVFGYYELQEIAHRIEDIFDRIMQKRLVFVPSIADSIFKGLDSIKIILDKIAREETVNVDVSEICSDLEGCLAPSAEASGKKTKAKTSQKKTKKPVTRAAKKSGKVEPSEDESPPEPETLQKSAPVEYIRVPLSRVNNLLNLAGEMVINKMKSSKKISQAKDIANQAKEVQKSFAVLSENIKLQIHSKDEKISRFLSQSSADIERLREAAVSFFDIISVEASHLDPITDELQDKMKEMRMLPCSTIFEGFPRMVRDIASKQGKEVNLEIYGEKTELDKKVLEGIKTPLMHILRNCVDHGIEEPATRKAAGKPDYGTIKISAFSEAGDVMITIEDDGAGMDIERIKLAAIEKRLITKQDLEKMTEKEITNLVFMNGYSTSPIITDISGRGIGLDIARRDIANLKGSIYLQTRKNKGTIFTLALPLTISIIQSLMIKSQGKVFAIPLGLILECLKVKQEDISTIESRMAIQLRGHTMPLVRLNDVLNLPRVLDEEGAGKQKTNEELHVVVTASMDKKIGFIVDDILGEEEMFLKSLGEHLGRINNVSGATILGTGEVIVILNVADLILNSRLSHPSMTGKELSPAKKREEKKILVVEDALSTRELEKSMLETEGYYVDTAVDGLDALTKVAQDRYDLVVSDINMPRMNGFEFCKTLKKNDEYKDVPVVMVTALDKEEDKRRGIEVGASAYIVKTSFDQTNLLDTIERLIG